MSLLVAPERFASTKDIVAYMSECEHHFRTQIDRVVENVLSHPDIRLLGLAGPSCSGKTTTAELLISELSRAGRCVHLISIDNFFNDRDAKGRFLKIASDGSQKSDFDSIDAMDLELFKVCLEELIYKGETKIPLYSFEEGKRVGWEDVKMKNDNDIFLLEGIQVVYPSLNALFRKYPYRSVFINVGRELCVNDVRFDPVEIRLMRRLVRDYYFRSAKPEFTFFSWSGVRENEEKSIFPYASACDDHLDSLMGYEIGILRPYLEKILQSIPFSSAYRKNADAILNHINQTSAQPLETAWLPNGALYREFVKI